MHKIITWIPESCIWVTFGIAFRAFRTALNVTLIGGKFNKHHIILNILIPPIILEGSYKLYSKELLFQIFGILNFAVLGTAFCIGCVGLGIYYLGRGISPNDSLLLATIVSAVDPVTVLAIFDQIKVTPSLYVLIFGESLLNDGVTLAAFESLNAMSKYDGTPSGVAYFLGIVSVITRTLGGAIIGILCGLISAIYTKFNNSKAYQALPLILLSYVCFMTAETLSFSGIAGIIGCGLVQRRYAFINIGSRSRHALARTTKFFAAVGEAIIFILLGEASYGASWKKRDMLFIMSVISICIVSRFIMVYTLGYICNKTKLTHISAKHLFVISYGGLRGAMSYVMIKTITVEGNKERKNKIDIDLFNEVTLSVVLFTIYILGGTVRFVAKAMKLRTSETIHTDRLLTIIIDRITQHATAGMESILGGGIRRMHSWIETMELFDNKYIRPYISRNQGLKSQLEVQKVMKKNLLKESFILTEILFIC
ncbi:Na(+)/H(+) exchanger protein 7 [Lepeophtheirus salmonis]|uniref:Na(+)/H(+) exchanger protein 7 n=1 Tax=Lepeophtheirus salmonis TaxID=72036 RepID=UPI003AF38772